MTKVAVDAKKKRKKKGTDNGVFHIGKARKEIKELEMKPE